MEETYAKIKKACMEAKEPDPIRLIMKLMQEPYISIHGPEHHVLDGSCVLAALHCSGAEFDLSRALDEMIQRGSKMPGAICGQWGVCGSAASVGAALAILHETGPLSDNQYYKDNLAYVSQALAKISEIGGPRCCKRNAFLSIQTAVDFLKERYHIDLPRRQISCIFTEKNKQCIGKACPYYPKEA